MGCCANCFGDKQLSWVIEDKSDERGSCRYCKSKEVLLVEPVVLQDRFSPLIDVYVRGDAGKTLVEWFREDWTMFQHANMDNAQAKKLLGEVLGDHEIVHQRVVPKETGNKGAIDRWDEFCEELRCRNRFFLKKNLDIERLEELFNDFLKADEIETQQNFFRARSHPGKDSYPSIEMGAPPADKSSPGRANPAGIPYLYLASDPRTAISEVRSHAGQYASVARFNISTGCRVLDLRDPKKTITPFLLEDEQEILRLRGDIGFLERLGDELSRPVIKDSAQIDYLPSQYLCEYAKHCGFDGVFFKSSVGSGFNFALFDTDLAAIESSVDVYRVSLEIEKQ